MSIFLQRPISRLLGLAAIAVLAIGLLASSSSAVSTTKAGHGLLTVETSPSIATQITVGGIQRNTSLIRGLELPAGSHVVCFGSVEDYIAPPCETIDIADGQVRTLVAHFEPAGTLSVTTEPSGASGMIVVDDIARNRGTVTIPIAAGEHNVCFGDVGGYESPDCERVNVAGGAIVSVTGSYAPLVTESPKNDESKSEPEPEPKPEPKPAPKPEPKPAPKPQPKPAPKPDSELRAWHFRAHNAGGPADSLGNLGRRGDLMLACDFNGDGRDTPATFRDGQWTVSNALNGSRAFTFRYGLAGDLPLCGDWNGNGKDTIGIVRDGHWHLRNSLSGGSSHSTFSYGRVTRGDIPIVGDWNANGRDTPGIIRDREWHLRNTQSSGPGQVVFVYGRMTRGDLPLVGDWNGNGRDGVGIVRDGDWHLRNRLSGGPGELVFRYGRVLSGDIPMTGDWNADGRTTVAIVR